MENYWVKFTYQAGSNVATSDEFFCCMPSSLKTQISELRKSYTNLRVELIVKL